MLHPEDKCPSCNVTVPTGMPKICSQLDQFIQSKFVEGYLVRKNSVATVPPSEDSVANDEPSTGKIHGKYGCEHCGVFPIVGPRRYRCVDCEDKFGFDLCEPCYVSMQHEGNTIEGRFSEQHNAKHRFKIMLAEFERVLKIDDPVNEENGQENDQEDEGAEDQEDEEDEGAEYQEDEEGAEYQEDEGAEHQEDEGAEEQEDENPYQHWPDDLEPEDEDEDEESEVARHYRYWFDD